MTALLHPCIGFISQVRCINPLLSLKIEVPAPSSRAAPGVVIPTALSGLGGDGADSAVPRCFQYCIQFLSFMLLLLLTIVQHVLCYLAHVDFLIMLVIYHGFTNYMFFYAKCFVSNDEIKLWNRNHINFTWICPSCKAIWIQLNIKLKRKIFGLLWPLTWHPDCGTAVLVFTNSNILHYFFSLSSWPSYDANLT